ncbi:MAG: hypothetical protein HOO07_03225 [Candidatus Marinimicrobia bacterium]|jgi:hypothetical protein|nr:hypothetical protein [Candidatus Neomarinimicrobiota bacterium]
MVINMGLIILGSNIIAPPEGMYSMDEENLKAHFYLFEFKHFVFPFLAHAGGTLVGAFIAAKIALSYGLKFAMGIGVFFLFGGIMMVQMLPSPIWFIVLDLGFAYLPMGWLGWKLYQLTFT